MVDSPFALTAEQQATLDAATAEPRLVALVAQAARTQWRAAAWLLERRHPERWSERGRPLAPASPPDLDDPFREVDELAERRRERLRPEGY